MQSLSLFLCFSLNICLCLPPDRTWFKVNGPKVDYSGGFGEGKVKPCLTMLVIDPLSAIWAWFALLDMDPNLGPQGPVLCKCDKGVNDATHPPAGVPADTADLSAASLPWRIHRPARMLNSQQKYSFLCVSLRHTHKHTHTHTHTHAYVYIYIYKERERERRRDREFWFIWFKASLIIGGF